MDKPVFEGVLERVQYKPGYILVREYHPDDRYCELYWEFTRPDRNNMGEWATGQSGSITVDRERIASPESLVRRIFQMTMALEEHETREFFLYDHRRPFDPHKRLV